MAAFISMLAIWILQTNKPVILNLNPAIPVDDSKLLPPPNIIKPVEMHAAVASVRHASVPNTPPVITPDDVADKTPPTNQQILTSVPGEYKDGPPSDNPIDGAGDKNGPAIKEVKPVEPVSAKENIEVSPGIPAQYPGGINEFIKFLKRNLRSPQDLEEDEAVTVKIKFIVSLNGDLLGFNVTQTGGVVFDNEVIRVLKKMPKWIPGKSNGENVSSYYTIPVKFTAEK